MFWELNNWSASEIDEALDKEEVTLDELLEKDEIIQECKALNKKLIEFLSRESTVAQLVQLVTSEPSEELDIKERYRFANVSCELLTANIDQINDALLNPLFLDKLCLFFETSTTLNPLLASFLSKIFTLLTQKRTGPFLQYLQSKECFIDQLLKHIQTSAVADFILKLITTVPKEHKDIVYNWLSTQQLMPKLVQVFKEADSCEAQTQVSQLLSDIIKTSRETQIQMQSNAEKDILLEEIESSSTVQLILDSILSCKTESALVNGLFVLQSLLEYKRHNAYLNQIPSSSKPPDESPDFDGVPQMANSHFKPSDLQNDLIFPLDAARLAESVAVVHATVVPRIGEFLSVLTCPPPKEPIKTAVGLIETPLGATRLEIAHLIRALISGNNSEINKKLREEKAFTILLDLFLNYPWNNFLHTQVEQCIRLIFENVKRPVPSSSENESSDKSESKDCAASESSLLAISLINESLIIHKLLDAYYTHCDTLPRPAFMGHLVKIIDTITSYAAQVEEIKRCLEEMDSDTRELLAKFTTDVLDPFKSRISQPLIADVNAYDLKDTQQLEAIAQRAYTEFKMQQMTKSSACQFSLDTRFLLEDTSTPIQSQADQLSVLNFNLDSFLEETESSLQNILDQHSNQSASDTGEQENKSTVDGQNANSSDDDDNGEDDRRFKYTS